jgi:serine/threonine-protein kinase
MAISIGERLGPYEITAAIGAGGMGEVYRAHDARLNRDVAIKTLPSVFWNDANRVARFKREAQALAALSHPNIAAIYGLEESGAGRALVMELVEGQTLAERIAAGPIPREEALTLARQIGDALEAAHEKGIVHRDLKPANIKLTADGKAKVLDFGLAKAFDSAPASGGDPTNSPTLTLESTRAGVILGTAGYMSPEQARGKPVDKRADIWAFGVVLFEMLTGKTTFEGETVSDTLAAVLRADIDWKLLPAGTPPKIRRLLQRCLERDPKKRLRDIGDAWIEIDAPDEPAPAAAAPAPLARSKTWWLPWAAAAAIGGAGLAWGLLHKPPVEPHPVTRWMYTQKDFFGVPALSHDGTKMADTELEGGTPRLALRMMDQLEGKGIPGSEGMYFPEFSPDGQWVAAFLAASDAKLKKIPVTGGTAITLAEGLTTAQGASWGDDDSIVFSGGKGLMRVSSSGGAAQTLTTPDTKKGELGHRTPHFLPGSRAVLFTIASGNSNQIAVLDLKKGSYRVVVASGADARYVPTGHLAYIRGGTLFAAPFDLNKLAVTGPEAPVVEAVATNGPNSALGEYAFSNTGLLVYMEGSGQGAGTIMAWTDRQGQEQPLSETQLWGTGRLSPDGGRIANAIEGPDQSSADLWVFEIDRHTKTRLTFGGLNHDPAWTPDGKRIAFGASVAGKSGLYTVPADGSGKPELLLATDSVPSPNSWSPDGKWVLYSMISGGKASRIYLAPVSGGAAGTPKPLHDTGAFEADAQISPDGKWVAYVSAESGEQEAYVQPFPGPGGKERVSTAGANSVRWAHSGKELYYMARSGGDPGIYSVEFQPTPTLHIGLPAPVVKLFFGTTWDPAPDGKRFLIEQIPGAEASGRRMDGVNNWFDELTRRVPLKR